MSFLALNIDHIENIFGLVVLIACTIMVFAKRDWISGDIRLFARGNFGATLLGDAYWTFHDLVFGYTPQYFYGAEIAWLAGELFLLLLVIELYSKEGLRPIHIDAWVGPLLIVILTIAFVFSSGDYVFNILMGTAMSGILLFSLTALFRAKKDRQEGIVRHTKLYLAATAFVVLEYAMWTCSVIDGSIGISNPYYWFQPLMYISHVLVALAAINLNKKSIGKEAGSSEMGDV